MPLHEFIVKETFNKPARCVEINSHPPSPPPPLEKKHANIRPRKKTGKGAPSLHAGKVGIICYLEPGPPLYIYIYIYSGRLKNRRGRAAYP